MYLLSTAILWDSLMFSSILGRIIRVTDEVINYRNWIKETYPLIKHRSHSISTGGGSMSISSGSSEGSVSSMASSDSVSTKYSTFIVELTEFLFL